MIDKAIDNAIEQSVDPELMDRLITRREALLRTAGGGALAMAGLALGSVPLALVATSREAMAQGTVSVLEVLRYAYTLENLEATFYSAVLGTATGTGADVQNAAFSTVRAQLTTNVRAVLERIRDHEIAHVNLLAAAIQQLSGSPAQVYSPADFDFTGGNGSGTGPFAQATTDPGFLLAAAQAFEDLGASAYKGQAPNLISNDAILTTALQIHAVEARHAARIRHIRSTMGVAVRPWIVLTNSGISGVPEPGQSLVNMIYANEGDVTQLGINVASLIPDFGGSEAASAAFDEPLDMSTVLTIVAPFIVGDNP